MSLCLSILAALATSAPPNTVQVAPAERGHPPGFVVAPGGTRFVPWGFNYDHDENSRLLEDYWANEWPKVEQDFAEMKELGAAVVRIHLQVNKFMKGADEPNKESLALLKKLLKVADQNALKLDITGLACYRESDTPAWYDALDEAGRWKAQARFWTAVAETCVESPAVFCYDLMNEPVVSGTARKSGEWLGGAFGGFCYVQFINLDAKGRPREEIAKAWIATLAAAVRKADPHHLVTLGMTDWSTSRPKTLYSGFEPKVVAGPLDFVSVHLYPEAGEAKREEALTVLKRFAVEGKPVVIEETFPLKCGADDQREFLEASRAVASGWVGFYWGKSADEYRKGKTISDAITAGWLDLFRSLTPGMTATPGQ